MISHMIYLSVWSQVLNYLLGKRKCDPYVVAVCVRLLSGLQDM